MVKKQKKKASVNKEKEDEDIKEEVNDEAEIEEEEEDRKMPPKPTNRKAPPVASMPRTEDAPTPSKEFKTPIMGAPLDNLCFGPWCLENDDKRCSALIRPLAGCDPHRKGEFRSFVFEHEHLIIVQKALKFARDPRYSSAALANSNVPVYTSFSDEALTVLELRDFTAARRCCRLVLTSQNEGVTRT